MVTIIEVVSQLMWVTIAIAISMYSYFFTPTGPPSGKFNDWTMIDDMSPVVGENFPLYQFPHGPHAITVTRPIVEMVSFVDTWKE
jgi:hypothetical protein